MCTFYFAKLYDHHTPLRNDNCRKMPGKRLENLRKIAGQWPENRWKIDGNSPEIAAKTLEVLNR